MSRVVSQRRDPTINRPPRTRTPALDAKDQRPQIDYPCTWTYRLIGPSEEAMRACVAGLLADRDYELAPSNESRRGRYVSLRLSLVVEDEARRLAIYEALAAASAVRLVL